MASSSGNTRAKSLTTEEVIKGIFADDDSDFSSESESAESESEDQC